MPFVSEVQRRKCYLLQRQANEKGLVSNWDCKKFGAEKSPSPDRKKRRSKASPKIVNKKDGEQIYEGPRGGKYYIQKNKKIYI